MIPVLNFRKAQLLRSGENTYYVGSKSEPFFLGNMRFLEVKFSGLLSAALQAAPLKQNANLKINKMLSRPSLILTL